MIISETAYDLRLHKAAKNSDHAWVLGTRIDATTYDRATESIFARARKGESCYICAANVHMIMEAYDRQRFRNILNQAAIVTPDGMPLVLLLRALGFSRQPRVYGPTLTLKILKAATHRHIPIGFYGSSPETLKRLLRNVKSHFPQINVAYSASPPFRDLKDAEKRQTVREINDSGTRILFVGLGCPKQEYWMAEHTRQIKAVLVGVGAAFDFIAGTKRQAPAWMMRNSVEWLFRLYTEPGRLYKRYLYHNPRFLIRVLLEIFRMKIMNE